MTGVQTTSLSIRNFNMAYVIAFTNEWTIMFNWEFKSNLMRVIGYDLIPSMQYNG